MVSARSSVDLTVSTTNIAKAANVVGGSASCVKRLSIYESRTGAQRWRRLVSISRKCMIAECRGEIVGESWDENVTRTGWPIGRRGASSVARSS